MYAYRLPAYIDARNGQYTLVVTMGATKQEYPLPASSPLAASLEAKRILDKLIQNRRDAMLAMGYH